jgi:hypothetical protein
MLSAFPACSIVPRCSPRARRIGLRCSRPSGACPPKNLSAVLAAAGTSMDRAVKVTVFLKNISDFKETNEVYAKFFPGVPPARSTVQAVLPNEAVLVEVDVIATQQGAAETLVALPRSAQASFPDRHSLRSTSSGAGRLPKESAVPKRSRRCSRPSCHG